MVNLVGHGLWTLEFETAVAEVEKRAKPAVAAREDTEKDEMFDAYAVVCESIAETDAAKDEIVAPVAEKTETFARPRTPWIEERVIEYFR